MNKLFLLTLLSMLYCTTKAQENIVLGDECSACQMPCVMSSPNSVNMSSLIRAYTNSYKGYRITTLLNGLKGYIHTTVTPNDNNQILDSARFNLQYWSFNVVCKILSHTLINSKNENSLIVQYETIPYFEVVKTKFFDNYLRYLLTESTE